MSIGNLLDDSLFELYHTETMPLSQQLSGLLGESAGVKASQALKAPIFRTAPYKNRSIRRKI